MEGNLTIDEAIQRTLDNSNLKKEQKLRMIEKAEELAKFYIDKKAPKGYKTHKHLQGDTQDFVGKLSALYGMQKIPNIEKLMKKTMKDEKSKDVMNDLLELASATKTLDDELFGTIAMDYDTHNGSMNQKVFKENIQVKYVSTKTINKEFREELGWKILRSPSSTEAGIIYRDAGDITYQSGLGTQLQLQPDLGVSIPEHYTTKNNNSTKNSNNKQSTVVFTNEELDTMGIVRDPIPALVKGYSHRMMLQETQSIREEIVNEFVYDYSEGSNEELEAKVKEGTHDWYIKLPDGVTIDQLPKSVRGRYKESRVSSDVDNFSDQVTLVRKDMSDFVEGY